MKQQPAMKRSFMERAAMKQFKTLLRIGFAAFVCCVPVATAEDMARVHAMGAGDVASQKSIRLGLDKSAVIELSRPAADLVITNPAIADAIVQTTRRIIFRGAETGETNAFVFDQNGKLLLSLEITVDIDTGSVEDAIRRYVPDARVKVESINGNLVVSGRVASLTQSDQVMRIVSAYVDEADSEDRAPLNMLSIASKDQVMLEVRIVEMQRNVIKQLGINLNASSSFGQLANLSQDQFSRRFNVASANGFGVAGSALGGLSGSVSYRNYNGDILQTSVGMALDALERVGIVRTLAEPNITAVSGETARFLAGGEFPVPVAGDNEGQISVEFKPYGVGLAFTPVVLSEGRISLKVSTEISELSSQGSFQGQTDTVVNAQGQVIRAQTLTIPALIVRRAESIIELPSGSSTMLAGLIQSRSRQALDQLPGIKKLPVLGALFQSRDFINEETEMVVIITPYLVDPTSKQRLRTPADGYVNASDSQTIFFGKLNAQYAMPGRELSSDNYRAPVGFIEE